MVHVQPSSPSEIIYPDSDGQPMADNTKQFRWIVTIKENLEWLFADDVNVFVAGDLLWYPIEGDNKTRIAPDAMVVFGRPKGDRGSYQQWQEDHLAPQVVFEILSPGNRRTEMDKKLVFYDRFGVEEYYLYDPDDNDLSGWLRMNEAPDERLRQRLNVIDSMADWISPRLKIRFHLAETTLQLYRPDGKPFLTYTEVAQRAEQVEQRAEQAEQRAEQAEQQAARLADQLRALGVDPDTV